MEGPVKLYTDQTYSGSTAAEQLSSSKKIKHLSSSEQIKLISTAWLQGSEPSCKQHFFSNSIEILVACQVLYKSHLFWQHSCRAACQVLTAQVRHHPPLSGVKLSSVEQLRTPLCNDESNSTMGLHNPSLPQTKQLSKMWNSSRTVAFDCCLTYFLCIYPVSVLACHMCSWLVRCLQVLLKERWQGTQIGNPSQNIYSEPDVLHCISCGHWPGFNSFIYVQTRLNLVDPQFTPQTVMRVEFHPASNMATSSARGICSC